MKKQSLAALSILSLSFNVFADNSFAGILEGQASIRKIFQPGKNIGLTNGDCDILFLDQGDEKFPSVHVSIISRSAEKVLAGFSLMNVPTGSTIYSQTQVGKKISIIINQDFEGKQLFKYNGKKKLVTLSSNDKEASCTLK